MQLTYYKFLLIPAFISLYTAAQPGAIDSVDIIEKLIEDLESSPTGYAFHRYTADVHPGGYDADVNHGKAKIAARLGMETISSKMESRPDTSTDGGNLDMIQTYKSTGGYSFVISHDYGTQKNYDEIPGDSDAHYGASNAKFQSIAPVDLDGEYPGRLSTDVEEKSEAVQPGGNERFDSDGEKGRYGSYTEYDKAIKDGKKRSSVNPGEYYGVEVDGGRGKYNSDDRYGEYNNRGEEGSYPGFEKYDESDGYEEYANYDSSRGRGADSDEEQLEEYVFPKGYTQTSDFSAWKKAGLFEAGYRGNDDEYEQFKANYDHPVNSNENFGAPYSYIEPSDYNTEPKYENVKDYLMSDFFKDYNNFFNFADERTHHVNDQHEDEYYNNHGTKDADSLYHEAGEKALDFFDDANLFGNHNEEGHGEENSRFGEKKGHKKGSKTTGYHNVLHKDEYTKDHTFYANANNKGHFDKGADYDAHNFHHEGDYKSGGNHEHSSSDDHYGETDSEKRGHSFKDDLSRNNEHGHKSYFDDNLEYGNEGNNQYGNKYGDSYDSDSYSQY